jgi:hypothetical protein
MLKEIMTRSDEWLIYYKPKEEAVTFSIRWPKSVVESLDRHRGEYLTKNMYLLKLVQEHFAEMEKVKEAEEKPREAAITVKWEKLSGMEDVLATGIAPPSAHRKPIPQHTAQH